MRILMVTDAWLPQMNGVVHTLKRLSETLTARGVETEFLTPQGFASLPLPTYPDIRLALATRGQIARRVAAAKADHVHIVTEGPLGILARRHCRAAGRPFTTSYHTKFPEYLSARFPVPENWAYRWLRRFHNAGEATLVATRSLSDDLSARGFTKLTPWTHGVDTTLFQPDRRRDLGFPAPVFLYVGRIAVEKNLPAFLDLDLPGSKVLCGDGPELERLRARYPDAHFLGRKASEELAGIYASADVFVFPSRTDTFGNVIIESLASGTPVAAYPVTGPIDIVGDGIGGVLSEDLREAAMAALGVSREAARRKAANYTWKESADMFLDAMNGALSRSRARPPEPRDRPGADVERRKAVP